MRDSLNGPGVTSAPASMRRWAALGGAAALLLVASSTGCQAVVDFDEARICTTQNGADVDCTDPDESGDIPVECRSPFCNPQNGRCEYPVNLDANGDPCEVDDPCLLATTCLDGECVGTPAPEGTLCDDNPCNPGFCDADGRCVNEELRPGDACTPNTICTAAPGVCVAVPGRIPNCLGDPQNDFDPCEDDGLDCTANTCFNGECLATDTCPEGERCDPETNGCLPEE